MTFPAGTLLNRYELLEPLRSGRLSEVYRARDTSIGRLVAIKVLPSSLAAEPGWLRRFEQEARLVGSLDHPNILNIHDVGVHEGRPYLVSELLQGETLRERLAVSELPWQKAVTYGIGIAQGMAAAHEKGIVHRDLKPENLFLTQDGRMKILDFGLARVTPIEAPESVEAQVPTLSTATEPGLIMGTAGYMSPEQVRGQAADVRSDIFSFGSILFEMTTGRRAFRAASTVETLVAILREEPVFPPAEGPLAAVLRIVRRCLEKNPQERFQSARDLAYALEELLANPERRRTSEPRSVKKARRPRSFASGSGASGSGEIHERRGDSDPGEDSGFRLLLPDREVRLRTGANVIGRGRDVMVRLHEKSISRHHARIIVRDAEAMLEDLQSKNGCFINGERIEAPVRLEDGDTFRLGSVSMTFRTMPDTGSTDTQSPT
jgi:serine/threonine protein kinase